MTFECVFQKRSCFVDDDNELVCSLVDSSSQLLLSHTPFSLSFNHLAVLPVALRSRWLVARSCVGLSEAGGEIGERRALKVLEEGRKVLVQGGHDGANIIDTTLELGGKDLLEVEEDEASQVVTLEKGVGRVNAVGDVGDVNADVAVLSVNVTTEAEAVGVGGKFGDQIGNEAHGAVGVLSRALVPVLKPSHVSHGMNWRDSK